MQTGIVVKFRTRALVAHRTLNDGKAGRGDSILQLLCAVTAVAIPRTIPMALLGPPFTCYQTFPYDSQSRTKML